MSSIFTSMTGGSLIVEETPTIQAAAYASGDLVGGKITLTGVGDDIKGIGLLGGAIIQSVIITDLAKQNVLKDVVFFDSDPSNTTFTENGPFDPDDVDLLNLIGIAHVNDWVSFNDSSAGQALRLALPFVLDGSDLYAAIVERGAPTYASTSDLTIRVGIMPA